MLSPPHEARAVVTPMGAHWLSVSLHATLFDNVDLLQLMGAPVVWEPQGADGAALRESMAALVREWSAAGGDAAVTPDTMDSYVRAHWSGTRASDATSLLLCDAYARAVVGLCWRALTTLNMQQAADHGLPAWFSAVLEQLHADPNVSVDQLARGIGISTAQLRRHFQRRFGASPREYLNRVRLEDARQLLETTDLSAADIARRIGFHSASHFNTLFKNAFAVPPAQYRELSRQPRAEAEP
jgi:transcriptional regulator GlxA family with amidase domain